MSAYRTFSLLTHHTTDCWHGQRPTRQGTTLRGVGQDKGALPRAPVASLQPAPQKYMTRPRGMNRNCSRSQNRFNSYKILLKFLPKTCCFCCWPVATIELMKTQNHSKQRKTVHVTLWVKPEIKAELKRLAEKEGVSVSATGGSFLEEAIRQQLHVQHAVLLQPIIEQAISKRMAAISTRLSMLLVRGVLDAGQIRRLVINILARQPGMTEQVLDEIIDGSMTGARKHITRMTPQLTSLIAEVEQWLSGEADEEVGHN